MGSLAPQFPRQYQRAIESGPACHSLCRPSKSPVSKPQSSLARKYFLADRPKDAGVINQAAFLSRMQRAFVNGIYEPPATPHEPIIIKNSTPSKVLIGATRSTVVFQICELNAEDRSQRSLPRFPKCQRWRTVPPTLFKVRKEPSYDALAVRPIHSGRRLNLVLRTLHGRLAKYYLT